MSELINFFMDPLRLTLIIAGVAVLLAIILFGRKSRKRDEYVYSMPASKEFTFGAPSNVSDELAQDTLVDEEVIVLPRKQKESERNNEMQSESVQAVNVAEERDAAPFVQPAQTNGYNIKAQPQSVRPVAKKQVKQEAKKIATQKVEMKAEKKVEQAEHKEPTINEFSAFESNDIRHNEKTAGPGIFEEDVLISPNLSTQSTLKTTPIPQAKSQAKPQAKPQAKLEKKEEKRPAKTSDQTAAEEMFIVLHIIAVEGEPFNGLDILDATKTQGMGFGKHAIFHYPMSSAPAGDSKFCLVNMSATGNFETTKISSIETNGISLIMRLPLRNVDTLAYFSNMVSVAQALAIKLGGEILDQSRKPLTAVIVEDLRADISRFEGLQNATKYATSKESTSEVAV